MDNVYKSIYLHSLFIFCTKTINVLFVYWARLWDRREGVISIQLSINPLISTACLNLEQQVFAYCLFVYNLYLIGHEKQKKKQGFPLFFPHFSTNLIYIRKVNTNNITKTLFV